MSDHKAVIPYAQPPVPSVSFGDMQQLAVAVAKSGLFGIKTPDQALALMALAQAEGRHPATVARDYHIINGSPAKKAEAMQRDFLMSGGKIEWHKLTDSEVAATFSHPLGGTARICWDSARVAQAQLGGNAMHKKYPRQMLRSRVVSEGVRTVWPLATSGMYVPEEVSDFASPAPADTRSELDAFASAKPAEIVDAGTGEILDEARIEYAAMEAASRGTNALRDHLRGISREARAALNGKIGTRDTPGSLLLMAMRADDDGGRDPFDELPHEPPAATNRFYREPPPNSPAGDVHPKEPHGAVSMPAGETHSSGASAEPMTGDDEGQVAAVGRTARATRATGATHSPAGDGHNGNQTERSRAVAAAQESGPATPAGDQIDDLLGGLPRKPAGYYHVTLADNPNADDWDSWHGAITSMIGNDPHDAILRDNRTNLEIFGQFDGRSHALMRRLEAR